MSFLLHFSGPSSFEQTVALKPRAPAVVVGRDKEAAVYLPDAERLVSRRHLSIEWSEAGARLTVLSGNGINTDHGDYFSGDVVVLAEGESARIGSYSLIVSAEPAATDLDATSFAGMGIRPMPAGPVTLSAPGEDLPSEQKDPWADLLSQHALTPQQPSAPPPASGFARAPEAGDTALQALCRGLGVRAPAGADDFDWEMFGASVRHVVECLGDHLDSRLGARRDMRAEDRTLLGSKEKNPLKGGMPVQDMLHYLLFARDGVGGYVPANKALQEVAQDARAHEASLRSAARGLAEGAIREFDSARLRGALLKGKLSMAALVDNARLWDLYTAHYEKKVQQLPDWTEQLFNRYYMAAYLREAERLRRSRLPPVPQRTE